MANINFDLLKFETDFYTVGTSQYIQSICNSLLFINNGTSVVNIESVVLQPNQTFAITGNSGEITEQRFFINFGASTSGNLVTVVRKRYTNI